MIGDRDYGDVPGDKQWASDYILGPLYDPEPSQVFATRAKVLPPTPPASPGRPSHSKSQEDEDIEEQPFFRRLLSRNNSVNKRLPPSPPPTRPPRISTIERKKSVHTANPPTTSWNQGTILARSNSVSSSRPSVAADTRKIPSQGGHRRAISLAERYPGDRSHRPLATLTQEHMAKEGEDHSLSRNGSLRERFPGDMSHRPLAMLKRDHRAADRAPHLRSGHRRQQPSDTIDSLDHSGPNPNVAYHHGGPFDPTMKARNANKMYSPVEAVRDTNLEALKATPEIYLKDSLTKHVPLQGTAIVAPGMRDMLGRTMDYQEGADLMRESDAPGGAYKRWDHIPYADDDLKGKGEPFFTLDQRDAMKSESSSAGGAVYEMTTPVASGLMKDDSVRVRQRSISNTDETPSQDRLNPNPFSDSNAADGGIRRRNTTGKSLAQTLKARFGSLRRKKSHNNDDY
ncbi:hypothetical protein B0T25DRAFT_558028 [Lasiosphaeria hispida]|uniref:Pal1 cell morphology protein n=1 Tax=Lasiosphaeria hispida TaxID=260671 RepID=A0AAJ0H6J7_9PEZI|nr:hypothetical protein B0T25DRAFT_558028 [Lasiosphaeria hispida]